MKAVLKCRRKNFSDTFPIKNCSKKDDPLSPKHLHFDLECANRRVQVDQEGLK